MSFLEISDLAAGCCKASVLRNLALSVGKGRPIVIVWRSGAGKFTLLFSIFDQTRLFGGQIRVAGTRIDNLPAYRAAHLGVSFSPQGRLNLPNLTVRENLSMSPSTGRQRCWFLDTVYDLFPVLKERAGRPGTVLLGGGSFRCWRSCRALMSNPEVLVQYEQIEGLAPVLVDTLMEALKTVRDLGRGILVVEQRHALIRAVTDRFMVTAKGQIRGGGDTIDMSSAEYALLFEL